ncbi:hypothetical protein R8871_05150 [Paraburkholderia graminis C4D1M]|jgi:hypothetical protein|uniref:SnoaL-like domain-containing protein n=1 Tax=Paraburkholderia graminis (strain ATCC 700544 / DSM 17151 / LMG 18924 / NCIMB 13744 / C4D1M) TaxID=396598 RepID=B1G6M1_PARG4|nr:hypothetical protein BgramDRAFT_4982 [Paraburkholderia graminis C4D1M]CAB3724260.1 hypothetical protein R8871_05150 [Paraburkholderia graminis C4D1M]
MHALRALRESGAHSPDDIRAILAANVVFNSPVLTRPLVGAEIVSAVLAASALARGIGGQYVSEYRIDAATTVLRWRGSVQGHLLESIEILVDDAAGLLVERTIAYRPLPAVEIFRDLLYPLIKDIVPADLWAY